MITFYQKNQKLFAVEVTKELSKKNQEKLTWLFGGALPTNQKTIAGFYVGPRKEMITPWSTNAVEITQNMDIKGITRIEELFEVKSKKTSHDSMLQYIFSSPSQDMFFIDTKPEQIVLIDDVAKYNADEGLALSTDEVDYLNKLSKKLKRKLTDSEVFGFSQVNSEHCRHKIFNGTFIIDGKEKQNSLFSLIKQTSKANHNFIVSAYKDNVAFIEGPRLEQFAPKRQDAAAFFETREIDSIISIKAETHNFPTTVEPFNGAATGSGGEIRDRMAGGIGSIPLAGTAVYMTSYPRLSEQKKWELAVNQRNWLYQTPAQILTKASNGASDFGNKFGQPLICGSLLTFEHKENNITYGYDKVIMLAGGIGYGRKEHSHKTKPSVGDVVVVLGGDNYRIGMGGGAVSSVATGQFESKIELNAVQRSNPEMQKRTFNTIRAMSEMENNPIVSLHDHGAGGHLNCLSELLEDTGGTIRIADLPVGDHTLSSKEIVGNESQERMGLVIRPEDLSILEKTALRERAPMYAVGNATDDMIFRFEDNENKHPINLELSDFFGSPPKTVLVDSTQKHEYKNFQYKVELVEDYILEVLRLEAVACKDWLTNKVDRSVTGRVAMQQCAGELQLPMNNLGVMAVDFRGKSGIATSLGHAPVSGLVDAGRGSVLSIAKALTNIVWAPLTHGLKGVSLSANWMWPAKNNGEDARLYEAVEAASVFAQELGINIPTGKDSLSMTQKYNDQKVYSPGTVIISAVGEVSDVQKTISPPLARKNGSLIYYIDFSESPLVLGGSSFAQSKGRIGNKVPTVASSKYFIRCFEAVQRLVNDGLIYAGHDISSGGMITSLLEMMFATPGTGMQVVYNTFAPKIDIIQLLFSENPGVLIQVPDTGIETILEEYIIDYHLIGKVNLQDTLIIERDELYFQLEPSLLRQVWFRTSYELDKLHSGDSCAKDRFTYFERHLLKYNFPKTFTGKLKLSNGKRQNAAIIREKGVNGDREMAYSMHYAGFDVKDVHMTDLISGRETLADVNFIVFVGGFSNSDVLGSAKGWAGAFLYNEKARKALENFYTRPDTLSLGVCNGCQLMMELDLIYPKHQNKAKMTHNNSNKFESGFINVNIEANESVMLKNLSGSRLGVWIAHGEGKFVLPNNESAYNIAMKYSYKTYPANPNGSSFGTAALTSDNGRHIAMMPHLERSAFKWQWAHYPDTRPEDEITPWMSAFCNARKWIKDNKK